MSVDAQKHYIVKDEAWRGANKGTDQKKEKNRKNIHNKILSSFCFCFISPDMNTRQENEVHTLSRFVVRVSAIFCSVVCNDNG